jgi:hypothetical protein
MRHLRNRTSLVRWIAALLLMVFLQGCMHWSVQPLEPKRFNSNDPPHKAQVFLTSGGVVADVSRPFIQHDSLIWSRVGSGGTAERQGIPLAEIAKVEIWKVDGVATAALVVVPPVGLFVLFWMGYKLAGDGWGSF